MLVPLRRFFYVSCAVLALSLLPLQASLLPIDDEPISAAAALRFPQNDVYTDPSCFGAIIACAQEFHRMYFNPLDEEEKADSPCVPFWLHWLWPTAYKASAIIHSVEEMLSDPKRLFHLKEELKPHYNSTVMFNREQVCVHLLRMHVNTLTDVYLIDEIVRRYPKICSAPRVWYAHCIDKLVVSELQLPDRALWVARGHPDAFVSHCAELLPGKPDILHSFINKWAKRGLREARTAKVEGFKKGIYGFEQDSVNAIIHDAIWFGYDVEEEDVAVLPLFGIHDTSQQFVEDVKPFITQIEACKIGTVLAAMAQFYGLINFKRDPESARRLIFANKIAY